MQVLKQFLNMGYLTDLSSHEQFNYKLRAPLRTTADQKAIKPSHLSSKSKDKSEGDLHKKP